MGRVRCGRAVLFLAVVSAAFAGGAPARGDVEETELRLKTAGVPDRLRERIRASIARGATFLIERQRSDGSFTYPGNGSPPGFLTGTTALASLALAHSGGPAADDAAQRGLAYLTPEDGKARPSAVSQTYAAGLTAMLLQALRSRPGTAATIVRNLAALQDPASGWWGYGQDGLESLGGGFGVLAPRDIVNLSTTQYGALGLWAGSRASGKTSLGAWRLHLRGVCAFQHRDGSWGYGPRAGSHGYPNGTFMGLASLALCRGALAEELEDDPALAAQAAVALRAGLRALDRDGPAALRSEWIDYYGFYALEKACVFLDAPQTGGLNWYVVGAERLLADQLDNGGWGGTQTFRAGVGMQTKKVSGDCISTGFALLFLLRVSETFHPTTPRGVHAAGPTTPGTERAAPGAPDARPAVPPPPRPVLLADAESALVRLARFQGRLDGADESAEAVGVIAAALRRLEPAPPAPDATPESLLAAEAAFLEAASAWRDRAGAALVEALGARTPRVARLAAEALARGPRSASEALRTRIDRILRGPEDGGPRAVVEAAFAAVAAQGDARSLAWLATRVTTGRKPLDVRASRAALLALARWEGGSAAERRAAALRVTRALDELERSAATADPDGPHSWTAAEHWRQLGPPALAALASLCRDPEAADGTHPWADGAVPASVAEFAAWLQAERRR